MKGIIGALLRRSDARPACAVGVVSLAAGWFAVLATATARIAGARLSAGDVGLLACLAAALLASGATMLILDALQNGFGALDAFFQEALARSARRASEEARPSQRHSSTQRRACSVAAISATGPMCSIATAPSQLKPCSASAASPRFAKPRNSLAREHRPDASSRDDEACDHSAAASGGIPRMAFVSRNSPKA